MSLDCRFHSERFSGSACSSPPFEEGPTMQSPAPGSHRPKNLAVNHQWNSLSDPKTGSFSITSELPDFTNHVVAARV